MARTKEWCLIERLDLKSLPFGGDPPTVSSLPPLKRWCINQYSATNTSLHQEMLNNAGKVAFKGWSSHHTTCQNVSLFPSSTSNLTHRYPTLSFKFFHTPAPKGPWTLFGYHPPHILQYLTSSPISINALSLSVAKFKFNHVSQSAIGDRWLVTNVWVSCTLCINYVRWQIRESSLQTLPIIQDNRPRE